MCAITRGALWVVGLTVLCTKTLFLNAAEKEMQEAIYESAWQHMEPELAACEDLECIENLLHFKEKQLALMTLVKSGMPIEQVIGYMQEYSLIKSIHKQLIKKSPIQEHETSRLDKDTVYMTRSFLEKSGINPHKVKITGRRISSKEASLGRARGAALRSVAEIQYPSKKRYVPSACVIAHEVTHLDEAHTLKRQFVQRFSQASEVDIFQHKEIDANYYFSKMSRMQEMQADLLPFLRFKEHVIGEQLLKVRMPECEYWYKQGKLDTMWHQPGNTLSTHAGCTEELQYILKINDLRQRGAVPLYEKEMHKKGKKVS